MPFSAGASLKVNAFKLRNKHNLPQSTQHFRNLGNSEERHMCLACDILIIGSASQPTHHNLGPHRNAAWSLFGYCEILNLMGEIMLNPQFLDWLSQVLYNILAA